MVVETVVENADKYCQETDHRGIYDGMTEKKRCPKAVGAEEEPGSRKLSGEAACLGPEEEDL